MKKLFLLGGLAIVLLAACTSNTRKETSSTQDTTAIATDTVHTSQNSLDWSGTYKGILPCADCPGIETTVVLNANDTFSYMAKYQDRDFKTEDKGKIMWHDNGSVVHLKGQETDLKYKVGENQLIQLDTEGKEITGALSKYYILAKQ
ncbi:copper resistance protein NlpE [Pedobacter montanisoli]|uniref:Copper resistance protein NlpE N-terminal domain-containing protein n=1 Tax=Pedobacter montanisoli TaxID=2923277 RepID=A0ABS9ZWJ5_9SPHI|nr:copper resistance protein NlpE N-terminal domain-containing protein [Pedobacter montanisoli]MCJ0742666.1 copper resistance protein NlpE N-terminal domain-containing protein [Pedobacter montanisoli]